MAKTVEIPVKVGLDNAWIVRPGDKLVLVYDQRVSEHDAQTIKAKVADQLPGVETVIINGVQQVIVYRPDPGDDAIEKWIHANPSKFEAWIRIRERRTSVRVNTADFDGKFGR